MAKNEVVMGTDSQQIIPAAIQWMFELQLIESPLLSQILYGNLFSFPHVVDCELLLDRNQRKMLIYIRFDWLTRRLLRTRARSLILEMSGQIRELLPSFEFRIVEDRSIFELALKKSQDALFGGKVEQKSNEVSRGYHGGADAAVSSSEVLPGASSGRQRRPIDATASPQNAPQTNPTQQPENAEGVSDPASKPNSGSGGAQ